MSPKTLQMIMGHSSIEFTLNVYTHLESEDIVQSFQYLSERSRIGFGDYTASQIVPDDDDNEDEGEVDWTEEADDDDEE